MWQPEFSRKASFLRRGVSGRIVDRVPPPSEKKTSNAARTASIAASLSKGAKALTFRELVSGDRAAFFVLCRMVAYPLPNGGGWKTKHLTRIRRLSPQLTRTQLSRIAPRQGPK
jgi:hypothetical protein